MHFGALGRQEKKCTPPISKQVQVCLIASFSTLPNRSLLPGTVGPFVPPSLASPATQVMLNPSPIQFMSAGAVSSREGWEEAAGLRLQVPSPLQVQTAFFFLLQKYHFPPTPLQPAKSPLITILFFCYTTSPCCNRSEPLIILIIFLAALPKGLSQAQGLVTIGTCMCLETVLALKRLQTVNRQYRLSTYTCAQGTFCTLPKGNQHPPETG